MKRLLFGSMLLALVVSMPSPALAAVDVGVRVHIPLPPLIVFPAPPEVVVIPETYVYAVPDIDADIFFYGGWWWRPWEGRWYRSRHHDRGWAHYPRVPAFYKRVPPGWRNSYRERNWRGHEWEHRRVPHRDVEKNWRGWQEKRHWEKDHPWGVRGLEPRKDVRRPGKQPQYKGKKSAPPPREAGPRGRESGPPEKDRRDRK